MTVGVDAATDFCEVVLDRVVGAAGSAPQRSFRRGGESLRDSDVDRRVVIKVDEAVVPGGQAGGVAKEVYDSPHFELGDDAKDEPVAEVDGADDGSGLNPVAPRSPRGLDVDQAGGLKGERLVGAERRFNILVLVEIDVGGHSLVGSAVPGSVWPGSSGWSATAWRMASRL